MKSSLKQRSSKLIKSGHLSTFAMSTTTGGYGTTCPNSVSNNGFGFGNIAKQDALSNVIRT